MINGCLLVDKSEGISSFAVVDQVRKLLRVRKAGHCGTLDPFATGLLIVCFGKATKLSLFIANQNKSYVATIELGRSSDTFDNTGKLSAVTSLSNLDAALIERVVGQFEGKIRQRAPIYSALKHRGRPLYEYARRGLPVIPKERDIEIESINVIDINLPLVTIEVSCSKGTYIRSLANDIGERLDCGGHLTKLRRTSIGRFTVDSALTLNALEDIADSKLEKALIGVDNILDLPSVTFAEQVARQIANGPELHAADIAHTEGEFSSDDLLAVRDKRGRLLALGRALFSSDELPWHSNEKVIEYLRVI